MNDGAFLIGNGQITRLEGTARDDAGMSRSSVPESVSCACAPLGPHQTFAGDGRRRGSGATRASRQTMHGMICADARAD